MRKTTFTLLQDLQVGVRFEAAATDVAIDRRRIVVQSFVFVLAGIEPS